MQILRRGAVGILVIAFAIVLGPQVLANPDSDRPLTPDWIERVAKKEQARAADARAGSSAQRAPNPAGPDTPARLVTKQVGTSKADMRQRFEAQRVTIEQNIAALTALGRLATAEVQRADLNAQLAQIETYPDGEFTIDVPALETGGHSIMMSTQAFDCCNPRDPISFAFYNVGSSWDTWYDLQNFTTPRWSDEAFPFCVSGLQAYTWDAQHGGSDGWEYQDYQMVIGPCEGIGGRHHLRLFDRGYWDSHGQYGRWSFSEPHHDSAPSHCVDDWEGAQELLHQSFIDDYGQNHLFVGAMYQVNWGNGATYGCATADGWGWYVEFLY